MIIEKREKSLLSYLERGFRGEVKNIIYTPPYMSEFLNYGIL